MLITTNQLPTERAAKERAERISLARQIYQSLAREPKEPTEHDLDNWARGAVSFEEK